MAEKNSTPARFPHEAKTSQRNSHKRSKRAHTRRSALQLAILKVEAQLRREYGESAVRDLWIEIRRRTNQSL
jgi:hypothetical protein